VLGSRSPFGDQGKELLRPTSPAAEMLVGVGPARRQVNRAQSAVTLSAASRLNLINELQQTFEDGLLQSDPTKVGSQAHRSRFAVRSRSRSMMSIGPNRHSEHDCSSAPLLHMPKLCTRSVLQERGCLSACLSACQPVQLKGLLEALRLGAWSNVISPFSSNVSDRVGVLLEEAMQLRRCELSRLRTKRGSEAGRESSDQCNARCTRAEDCTGTNKVMYATCGSRRDDQGLPCRFYTIYVVCDMAGDLWERLLEMKMGEWNGCVCSDNTLWVGTWVDSERAYLVSP
jgi:hypothetical protein